MLIASEIYERWYNYMSRLTKQTQGVTIIEVVLVLAIAALIFLMIFIALPALQASQRDTSRKQDASIVSSAVTSFTSGERRALTATDTVKLVTYIDKMDIYSKDNVKVVAPDGNKDANHPTSNDTINVYPGTKCDGSVASTANASARNAAVVIMLDNNQNSYCVDAS